MGNLIKYLFLFTFILSMSNVFSQSKSGTDKRKVQLKQQRKWLKEYALCNCIQYGYNDEQVFDDLSSSIYINLLLYGQSTLDTISSISKEVAQKIEPSKIDDVLGRRAIIAECLIFYDSRKLDAIVRSYDKSIVKWLDR